MASAALRIALDVVLTIALSLLLLGLWQWFLSGEAASAFGESARLLFLFMDVGLVAWLVLLIVAAVRSGGAGPSVGATLLLATLAALLNVLVVLVVGFIQGGWAPLLVLFAVEAGAGFLIAVLVVVPVVHRLLVKAPTPR